MCRVIATQPVGAVIFALNLYVMISGELNRDPTQFFIGWAGTVLAGHGLLLIREGRP